MDSLTEVGRSELMARVRSKGNRSTELRAIALMESNGITGWVVHPPGIAGNPDLYFPEQRLALFVDGCFWHACPRCGRIPKSRVAFWDAKIKGNRRRDRKVNAMLKQDGYRIMRVWEHSLRDNRWIGRLRRQLERNPSSISLDRIAK